MGTFLTKLRFANVNDPARSVELEAMVDTGATYSWISRSTLESIGASPMRKMGFRTISGLIERQMAGVLVVFDGQTATDNVVVAEPGDLEVIGAFTLEALGVAADVVQQRLVPTVGWALTAKS